jgi:hypothetical protein
VRPEVDLERDFSLALLRLLLCGRVLGAGLGLFWSLNEALFVVRGLDQEGPGLFVGRYDLVYDEALQPACGVQLEAVEAFAVEASGREESG